MITVRADVRDPDAVLGHDALTGCIDFGLPVAVLLLGVLHFISCDEDAPGIIARFRERMAPGSYLAVSVGTSDGADPEMLAEATATYAGARMPFTLRSRRQIMDLFDGFEPGRAGPGQPARMAAGLQHRPDAAEGSHRRRRGPAGRVTRVS